MKHINLIPFLICISCASAQKISFKSIPSGASVTQEDSNGSKKLIGVTPLEVSEGDVFGSSSDMTYLLIHKDDHIPQKLLISRGNANEKIEIEARLESVKSNGDKEKQNDDQEHLAKSLAMTSKAIARKRYDEAVRLLLILIDEYPYLSVPHDLLGNIYFLQGNSREALVHYKKSAAINSDSVETQYMIKKLSESIKDNQ